ncbi:S8 family serine peptidase [Polyangium sp. y55x31]|uniref:S8 family peptidase n=1 Tax=Polyangium sp. y55x31 TaxID=3042688 RepID=UPI0024823430|nr:S8 family serine peptidase [Polyangium sp. y55x31]MDI1478907.1 S8 family serine peptidase [Polyangium sp. y55x31]
MSKVRVLIEVAQPTVRGFAFHSAAAGAPQSAGENALAGLAGFGIDVENIAPIPMFDELAVRGFSAMAGAASSFDAGASTVVVPAEVPEARLAEIAAMDGYTVWPNSALTLINQDRDRDAISAFDPGDTDMGAILDLARSSGTVEVEPYRAGVSIRAIRKLLGVDRVWGDGFRGQNIVVGIIDEGVNGSEYPVVGGYDRPDWPKRPGKAKITSHGSMCAADVLVAAPAARIYDYPFLGVPDSLGALKMFQAVLEQRRLDGTPHLTNNSYGYYGIPTRAQQPRHEVWDINHPIHRKVREVISSGVVVLFAAGNCGQPCPAGNCEKSSIGPGCSIHGPAALREVITVAAVNARHERVAYSSQGPALEATGFYCDKPDVAGYTHFFGNFGPGRPGGLAMPYDNGTSAATPVVAGVVALLLSAFPGATPDDIKSALVRTAVDLGKPGYDHETGYGVINAAAAYAHLQRVVGGTAGAVFPLRANLIGDKY